MAVTMGPVVASAQQAPTGGENLAYLITFGKDALVAQGDDDFVQIFFVLIPEDFKNPFFVRVFDPDVGGGLDEPNKLTGNRYNTKTKFSIYGGKGAFSDPDARATDPKGNYDSGTLLASKIFGANKRYDDSWYSFGPFNPSEGEYVETWKGKVFKIIAEGIEGDDGNLYKYFVSTEMTLNKPVEGANLFTYEYTCRLMLEQNSVAHLYPYMDSKSIAIKQSNFDFDTDGEIRLYSAVKNCHPMAKSTNGQWASSKHQISERERNACIDIQIHKKNLGINNLTFFITNQYDEAMPFFTIPIGGVPKYEYEIDVIYHSEEK